MTKEQRKYFKTPKDVKHGYWVISSTKFPFSPDITMSEFLNENPDILEENQLPTRKEDSAKDLLLGGFSNETTVKRRRLLLKIDHSLKSQVLQDIELLDKLLSIRTPPELTSDEDSLPEESEAESVTSQKNEEESELIDAQEIYDLIAHISDPEHPLSLGQLSVVNLEDIDVHDSGNQDEMAEVVIRITPTITHCSLATLIGLGIRVRLERSLPPRFRITILLKKGTHDSENQVNKQLNDKERVAAACENDQLLGVVSKMLVTCK
ncbi:YHR122W-like protein [Saccharomyces kudriavzevii IFO 1802]|uniref:YHR122W-like protein n=2 Tax=Saccharomyces kudriavzevii (strain ATCC MYA-4449 / AS 2.2408 / CBS 8840 / NBRC 1802 / NCYC 2889) TaxID=226230 RepID=J5PY64_SACK1|nr:YHR122W-like protein [Saccharomyces kudriavzevii IFO 1802]